MAILLALLGGWAVMSSIFNPSSLDASTAGPARVPQAGMPLLGIVHSVRYSLKIYAAADEPRYWVYSSNGQLLASDLKRDELSSRFEDLDVPALSASTLMMVDPDEDDLIPR
jgi:hypothetical protein